MYYTTRIPFRCTKSLVNWIKEMFIGFCACGISVTGHCLCSVLPIFPVIVRGGSPLKSPIIGGVEI